MRVTPSLKKQVADYLRGLLDESPWLDSEDLTRAAIEDFQLERVPAWLPAVVSNACWSL